MTENEIIIDSFAGDDIGNIFESTGYSIIRVTHNGKPENIKIPISTKGVDELRRRLSKEAPFPPVTVKKVPADSPEGVELGMEEDRETRLFDYTDKEYLDAMQKHGERVLWASVIQGLKVTWPPGCDSIGDKKTLLKKKGITERQAVKLFDDIMRLTVYQEGREDFLHVSTSDLLLELKKRSLLEEQKKKAKAEEKTQ